MARMGHQSQPMAAVRLPWVPAKREPRTPEWVPENIRTPLAPAPFLPFVTLTLV